MESFKTIYIAVQIFLKVVIHGTDPGLQLEDTEPLTDLSLWTC